MNLLKYFACFCTVIFISSFALGNDCPEFICAENNIIFHNCVDSTEMGKDVSPRFCHCFATEASKEYSTFLEFAEEAQPVNEAYKISKAEADRVLYSIPRLGKIADKCNSERDKYSDVPENKCYHVCGRNGRYKWRSNWSASKWAALTDGRQFSAGSHSSDRLNRAVAGLHLLPVNWRC